MYRFLALTAGLAIAMTCCPIFGEEPQCVVYDFSAKWCGPCRQMTPLVEKLAREGHRIVKVDVDEQPTLKNKYHVESIPAFVVVVNGQEVDRHVGAVSESDLRRMIAQLPTVPPTSSSPAVAPLNTNLSIPVQLGSPGAPTGPVRAPAIGPEETRVVENEPKRGLRDLLPFGRKAPAEPDVVRGNDSSLGHAEPSAHVASNANDSAVDPMQTSVRIRVMTNGRIDLGSGTVIASSPGANQIQTHILTCAHIFREFTEDSRIQVDLFERGRISQFDAKLLKFDSASDLGLIEIITTTPVATSKIPGANAVPHVGDTVAAVGCSGGSEPTRQQIRVTDIDKYDGPHNILCTGIPVRGRSGGGLFNVRGEIVGVCTAADEPLQRGFYSGLLAVHQLLDACKLTQLYAPQAAELAAAAPDKFAPLTSVEVAVPTPNKSASPIESLHAGPVASPLDVPTGDSEVIVIIRDKSQSPDANRVVIIHKASPKFFSYLSGELTEGGLDPKMLSENSLEEPALCPIPRVMRTSSLARSETRPSTQPGVSKDLLIPTTLTQPVTPERYRRSVSSRLTSGRSI